MRRRGSLPLGGLGSRHGGRDVITCYHAAAGGMMQRPPCTRIYSRSGYIREAIRVDSGRSFGLFGCYSVVFWPIRLTRLYSALYSGDDSDEFVEAFGAFWAFWADSALFVLFGSIRLDDSGRTSRMIRIGPNLPRMPRMPPESIRIPAEYLPNVARMKFVGATFGSIQEGIRLVLNISKQALAKAQTPEKSNRKIDNYYARQVM